MVATGWPQELLIRSSTAGGGHWKILGFGIASSIHHVHLQPQPTQTPTQPNLDLDEAESSGNKAIWLYDFTMSSATADSANAGDRDFL